MIIVRRCPGCSHLHLHRTTSIVTADGALRVGSCGQLYVLAVRPAVTVSASGIGGVA